MSCTCLDYRTSAKRLVHRNGPQKLASLIYERARTGVFVSKPLDKAVLSLLHLRYPGLRTGHRSASSLFCDRCSADPLSSDWVTIGVPVLRLGLDAASGVIDDQPVLLHCAPDVLAGSSIDDHEGWKEKSRQFLVHDSVVERSIEKCKPCSEAPVYRATYDAFREIPEMDVHAHALGQALNPMVAMPTDRVFTGRITGDLLAKPTNARGNEKKQRFVSRLTTSNGLHYDGDDKMQVLQTAATRYAVAQKATILDEEGRNLAIAIADNMFEEIVDQSRLADAWNDVSSSSTYVGWLEKSRKSGYAASHSLFSEEDDRILRFQGKGSYKAKEEFLSYKSTFKAPQGILAWSKGANSFFGYACRMISTVVKDSLKDHVVWNNGLSVEAAAVRFTKAAMCVPTPENIRLDAVEMDSKQNEFTHMINYRFLERLLVSCEFLDLYFSLYADYLATNGDIAMHLKWVKPSGAPFTLFGNSFLMCAMCLWLVRGDGPMALFTQGDDVDRNQANMRVDEERMAGVALYCAFEMSVEYGRFAAFCGYVLYGGQLVPNIRRKLIKLSGMNFRSQKHFEEVQIGMREWCDKFKSHVGFSDLLAVNAEAYEVPYSVAEAWFEAVDSLSHVDANQFRLAVCKVAMGSNYLAEGKRGKFDLFDSVY